MNFVILGAVLIQGLISKINLLLGAIYGLLVTIGIGIWGIGVYNNGGEIGIIGFALGEWIFYLLVAGWVIYDIAIIFQVANSKATIRLAKETNIYTTTDLNSEIVAIKNKGQMLQVSANSKKVNDLKWMQVISSTDESGYILGSTPVLQKFNISQKETLIYAQADTSSEVLETLAKGFQVEIGETIDVNDTSWVAVFTMNTEVGYMLGDTKGQTIID